MDISTIYHAALTVDSGVVSLYVNGVLEATKIINPSSISAFVGPLYIGYNPDGNTSGGLSRHLNGKIYSSRITNIIRYNGNFTVNTLNPYFPKK